MEKVQETKEENKRKDKEFQTEDMLWKLTGWRKNDGMIFSLMKNVH